MSKFDKLIQKIFVHQQVSYSDAEKILLSLGYEVKITGSHHVFRKDGYRHVTIKNRPQLLPYQLKDLEEALKDHGYQKTI